MAWMNKDAVREVEGLRYTLGTLIECKRGLSGCLSKKKTPSGALSVPFLSHLYNLRMSDNRRPTSASEAIQCIEQKIKEIRSRLSLLGV